MNRTGTFLGGMACGVGLMYILDPDRGPRRRALVRDQAAKAMTRSREFMGKAGRDLQNRAQGVVAGARRLLDKGDVTDGTLVERVRSEMGHHVSHPRAIDVTAESGRVTLRGQILTEETPALLEAVSCLQGVEDVDCQLEEHTREENIPALQGGEDPSGERAGWSQRNWTPGLQLMTGVATAVLVIYGARLARSRSGSSDTSWVGLSTPEYAGLESQTERGR